MGMFETTLHSPHCRILGDEVCFRRVWLDEVRFRLADLRRFRGDEVRFRQVGYA